jgi:hypothetical protein
MASLENRDRYERVLSATLGRTVDFVRYAEAKNAALLTFASAWMFGLINLLSGTSKPLTAAWQWCSPIAIILFAGAALCALRSFLPKHLDHVFRDPERDKSLIYYSDIAKFETSSFVARVHGRYLAEDSEGYTQTYFDDLAVQISANSKIAERKFILFNFGALVVCIALLFVLIPTLAPTITTFITMITGK